MQSRGGLPPFHQVVRTQTRANKRTTSGRSYRVWCVFFVLPCVCLYERTNAGGATPPLQEKALFFCAIVYECEQFFQNTFHLTCRKSRFCFEKCKIKKYFEKRLDKVKRICYNIKVKGDAGMAQSVEHVIGNDEVISSILITSSKNPRIFLGFF